MSGTYQGPRCAHGHDGTRYVTTRACVECARERAKRSPRPTTRAERKAAEPRTRKKPLLFSGASVSGLDALLDPAWAADGYAVTIQHKGRAQDGSPAGFRATVHAMGKTYTTKEGATAVPSVQHTGHGRTAADALADAVAKATGVFTMT